MNGYVNLNLGGVNRGLKFGNRALLNVMQIHQVDENLKFSFELIVDLVYYALLNNCLVKKTEADFTYEQVTEWVDDMPMAELTNVFQSFQASISGEPKKDGEMVITKNTAAKQKKL